MKYRLLVLFVSLFFLVGCGSQEPVESGVTTEEATENTETTEEPYYLTFEAKTIDGEELTSDILADSKLTMINIWATYCNPCLSEMPDLGQISASYDKADFQLIGIVSDVTDTSSEKDIENAKNLIVETQANYPHLLLNESLYMNLVGGVDSVPTTFFVTDDGEVLGYVIGARDKESWVAIIEELLAEQ